MSRYSEFFLSEGAASVEIETLAITHSSFTRDYFVVRNVVGGVELPVDGELIMFEYYPLMITGIDLRDNLDFGISVELGDLGDIIPTEVDRIATDNTYAEKPQVKYRTYNSADVSEPIVGPLLLEIRGFNFDREASSFEAVAPSLNQRATGELYTIERFPMLRGFL